MSLASCEPTFSVLPYSRNASTTDFCSPIDSDSNSFSMSSIVSLATSGKIFRFLPNTSTISVKMLSDCAPAPLANARSTSSAAPSPPADRSPAATCNSFSAVVARSASFVIPLRISSAIAIAARPANAPVANLADFPTLVRSPSALRSAPPNLPSAPSPLAIRALSWLNVSAVFRPAPMSNAKPPAPMAPAVAMPTRPPTALVAAGGTLSSAEVSVPMPAAALPTPSNVGAEIGSSATLN